VYSPNFTKQESSQIWGSMSFRRKLLYRVARWAPSLLPFVCKRMLVGNVEKLLTDYLVITGKVDKFSPLLCMQVHNVLVCTPRNMALHE
jgi:hypothetical protein